MSITSQFQSTLPVWGGTATLVTVLHAGTTFQSTLPVWGGTGRNLSIQPNSRYFNPPSPCGEGRSTLFPGSKISKNFNPPSPCGEGLGNGSDTRSGWKFQSTLPVWGGTRTLDDIAERFDVFQSTLPVWGGTLCGYGSIAGELAFQSTLPVWGGTHVFFLLFRRGHISIHPPRVGRDLGHRDMLMDMMNFNPPSPCGEGPSAPMGKFRGFLFQSTLPVWGGTAKGLFFLQRLLISIHPPRVGRDTPGVVLS